MALVSYPEFLQTRTYSAAQMRHLMKQLGVQEGVLGATDFDPSQRGAGANMSVDIAAGDALVQGDDVTRQGLYHVVNDAVVNAPIAAAHATLPRIDQVILHVYDSTVVGVSDVPLIEVVTGTPTAGATLDNRNGAAALPNNAIRLADVLVGAAVVTILDANIRDRRPWARGFYHSAVRSSGDLTTSSSSSVALSAADFQKRVECSGAPLRVMLLGRMASNTANTTVAAALFLDGVQATAAQGAAVGSNPTSGVASDAEAGVLMAAVLTPSAGSHILEPYWSTTTGIATMYASGNNGIVFVIEELVRQNASNN